MYFPYFRGRQYELLALKELAQKKLVSYKVIPIIEPIKFSPTFTGTLKEYCDARRRIALLLNPQVGDIENEEAPKNICSFIKGTVIPTILMSEDSSEGLREVISQKFDKPIIILKNQDYIEEYRNILTNIDPLYTLFPDERQIRRAVQKDKVLFEDRFIKREKNADYLKNEDEFYSDDHLYYNEEGYVGFGDYSIIGDYYEEGGFAPRAVAIHIVYYDRNNALRVHHFVSDNNYGIEDVAGKFYEAVKKLERFFEPMEIKQETVALKTLINYANTGYYPGLPTIKKISIMHHLELISKYLDGGFGR